MAGHSKWKNIQHRKGRQDAKRGQAFTKAAKEIIIAAAGGGDPAYNSRLRTAIAAGEYISIEEAQADYTKFFAVLKRFCSGLPSRVVGMIGSRISPVESRELEKDLNKEINDILRTFVLAATVKDGDGG